MSKANPLLAIHVNGSSGYKIIYTYNYGMRQKKLPLPFNETERNGPFNETERAVHDPFFIRSRSVRIFRPF